MAVEGNKGKVKCIIESGSGENKRAHEVSCIAFAKCSTDQTEVINTNMENVKKSSDT